MMNAIQNKNFKTIFVIASILMVALLRLVPHPSNFAPVTAMALFGGACLGGGMLAFAIPFLALIISDTLLNHFVYGMDSFNPFYEGSGLVYVCFALVVVLGIMMKNEMNFKKVILFSLSGSIIFFLITNFAVWSGSNMYPQTVGGLITCYAAAVPFFRNSILGDLFFNAVLFGSYFAVNSYVKTLTPVKA